MPVSKKRRKKYRPVYVYSGFNQGTIDLLKEEFSRISLFVLERLPLGIAKYEDIIGIMDFIDLVHLALCTRGCFDKKEVEAFLPEIESTGKIVLDIANRFKKEKRLVCRGDELRTVTDTFIECSEIIKDSIEVCPRRLLAEWNTIYQIIPLNRQFSENELKKMVEKNMENLNRKIFGK